MMHPPPAAPADHSPAAQPEVAFPIRILTSTLLLTALAWLVVGGLTYDAYLHSAILQTRNLRLTALRGTIAHLDEVLTMSARMAAMTGDLQWERRYRQFEGPLDHAIKQTLELTQRSATGEGAAQTDQANQDLVAMENRAFDFVHAGQGGDAKSVLFSQEYERAKKIYAAGMVALDDRITGELALSQDDMRWRMRWFATVTAVLVALILYTWLRALGRLQHWRRAVTAAVAAERSAHEQLENRVRERTSPTFAV